MKHLILWGVLLIFNYISIIDGKNDSKGEMVFVAFLFFLSVVMFLFTFATCND